MDNPGLILFGILLAALAFRLFAGGLDSDRVRAYIEKNGGRLIDASWAPFGKGWFGEKNDRIYEVRYVDRDGNEHEASCKTSLFSGVYFTEDRIVRPAERPTAKPTGGPASDARADDLKAENRRLREELERLKRRDA